MHGEPDADVREKRHAQPLQHRHVAVIRNEDLQQRAADAKRDDVGEQRSADQHAQRRRHRADVGADVDRVGDKQE